MCSLHIGIFSLTKIKFFTNPKRIAELFNNELQILSLLQRNIQCKQ